MLYKYDSMIARYGSAYHIGKAIETGNLFKVARGLYSDVRHPNLDTVACALWPQAVITMDSAFYLHGLTDVAPERVHVATPRNSTRIREPWVRQHFMEPVLMATGVQSLIVEDADVRVFSLSRMLVELMRNARSMPLDYYKELVSSYRKIADKLDMAEVEEYISLYQRSDTLFDRLQREVL